MSIFKINCVFLFVLILFSIVAPSDSVLRIGSIEEPNTFNPAFAIVPKNLVNYTLFPDWEPESYDVENWF